MCSPHSPTFVPQPARLLCMVTPPAEGGLVLWAPWRPLRGVYPEISQRGTRTRGQPPRTTAAGSRVLGSGSGVVTCALSYTWSHLGQVSTLSGAAGDTGVG